MPRACAIPAERIVQQSTPLFISVTKPAADDPSRLVDAKGGEFTSVFEGEDVNVIPFETLMDENDQTASAQLQMKMIAGLLKGITVVTKNVPEDTADWINTQIKQMMSTSTTTESK